MSDVQSRLSSKGQTVIPKAVRDRLGLKTGDLIRFQIGEKGTVTLAKVKPQEDDPFASFSEWTSDEDEALYGRLSRSRSATKSYCFRVPLNRSGRATIQTEQSSIDLFSDTSGATVLLRSSSAKSTPLKDAERWEFIGEGYASEIAATTAGKRLKDVLLVALARVRVGVSTGERGPGGFVTEEGLRGIEESTGRRAVNDIPGVTVYREPRPLFVSIQATGVRGATVDSFKAAFESSAKQSKALSLKEQISLFLFNSSFFQPAAEARLLLLVMAIEALLEPAPRSDETQAHIEEFKAKIESLQIPRAERDSLVGTLRWLKRESINQAGQRLVRERLPKGTYLDLPADKFFVRAYDLRSGLVHGRLAFPGFDEVSKLVGALELFAADLISAS